MYSTSTYGTKRQERAELWHRYSAQGSSLACVGFSGKDSVDSLGTIGTENMICPALKQPQVPGL